MARAPLIRRTIFLLCGVVHIAAAQGSIGITASGAAVAQVLPTAKIAVPVMLDMSSAPGGSSVLALNVSVTWGTSRLTLDSVKAGGFGTLTTDLTNASTGSAILSLASATGTSASITAGTLYFTAQNVRGGTHVLLSPNVVDDADGSDLLGVTQPRNLDVCVAPIGNWGDVNGDGNINIIDAQQLARYSVALSVANPLQLANAGDVTNDNAINIIDAQQIARFAVSLGAAPRVNTVIYTPPPVTNVVISSVTSSIAVGAPSQVVATPMAAGSVDLSGCVPVTWNSGAASTATVSTLGVVSGVAIGSTTITATSGGQNGQLPVTVVGAPPTISVVSGAGQLTTSGTQLAQPLTVLVNDGTGSPLPNAAVTWTVANGAGALTATTSTTDASGNTSVNFVPSAWGANSIRARITSGTGNVRINAYGTPAGVQRVWIGGASGSPRAFGVAGNWTGNAVPISTDVIYVAPAPANQQPQLSGAVTLGGLYVDPASSLDIQANGLTVNGLVDARGPVSGSGTLSLGTGSVSGSLPSIVVNGGTTIVGTTTVTGNLLVNNTLVIGAATLSVTGALAMNHYLVMQTPGGKLTVNGDVTFQGLDESGALTEGTLEVGGNFVQTGGANAYRTLNNHLTRFIGSSAQSSSFGFPSVNNSRFQNLEIANTGGGVTFTTYVPLGGGFQVTTPTTVTAGQIDVAGQITTVAGSNLSGVALLNVIANGAYFPRISGISAALVGISAAVTASQPTTLPGDVTVYGSLDIGSQQIVVTGNFVVGGLLVMQHAADKLTVNGNATFVGNDESGAITDGILEIKGNFSQVNGNANSFRVTGNHVTRFIGTGVQNISWNFQTFNNSRFQNLEIANVGGSVVMAYTPVAGYFAVTTAATVVGPQIDVIGQATTIAGSSLSGVTLLNVVGNGPIFPRINGTAPVTVAISASVTMSQATLLTTNLNVNTVLNMGGQQLTVTGNLFVGGLVLMQNANDKLTVNGNATFQGNDESGGLTAGLLEVKGNFAQVNGNANAFRTTGTHLTRLNGTGTQTVSFDFPSFSNSRFQNLEVTKSAGTVTFPPYTPVAGTFAVTTPTAISGGQIAVGDQATTAASSSLAGLSQLDVVGNGAFFPQIAGIAPPSTKISGAVTMTQPTVLPGALIVANKLTMAGQQLTVTGDFSVVGLLVMQNSADKLIVTGNAIFVGNDETGSLTDGILEIKGNFSQLNGNANAFRTLGNHTTRFTGSTAQSIAWQFAGFNNSRFQNVEIANTSGGVTFPAYTAVAGTFAVTTPTAVSGSQIDVAGQAATIASSDMSGVALFNVVGTGTVFPQILGVAPGTVAIGGSVTVSQTTTLPGPLTVNGVLNLGGKQLTVSGNFVVGGLLVMQDPADKLIAVGNATFAGNDESGSLTDGVLELKGNFAQVNGSANSFRTLGNHLTRFTGTGTQTVSWQFATFANSRFQNLRIDAGSSVTLNVGTYVGGNVDNFGTLNTVPTGMAIAGTLTLRSGSSTLGASNNISFASCTAAGGTFSGFSCP